MTVRTTAERLETLLGKPASSWIPISGGSIAECHRVTMRDGTEYFVKSGAPHAGMFAAEADGLAELSRCDAFTIPSVIAVSEGMLVLELLHASAPSDRPRFFSVFGEALAQQHRISATMFGFRTDNFIGATPQRNRPMMDSWKEFFLVHRLEFQLRLAEANGLLDRDLSTLFHRLEQNIDRLLPSDGEPPALLHGDLWNGNFLCVNDRPALFDPAVYYGHREMELAMTRLFGGFPPEFYHAYHTAYPLNDGWERRCDLYALYHLLNHLNLFGSSYAGQIHATLTRLLK